MRLYHTLKPFYNDTSKILILGSFPSPKSREVNFYYGHPQNRFWRVISYILGEDFPQTTDDKKLLLTKHNIALWDVLASCEIRGADDASIKKEEPNDLSLILDSCNIKTIFTTGGTAYRLYNKHIAKSVSTPCVPLPSTSPANCKVSFEELCESYRKILEHI